MINPHLCDTEISTSSIKEPMKQDLVLVSFRLERRHMTRLNNLAQALGCSRTSLIKEGIYDVLRRAKSDEATNLLGPSYIDVPESQDQIN